MPTSTALLSPTEQTKHATHADIVRFEEAFHDTQAAYYDEILTSPEPIRTYYGGLATDICRLVQGSSFVVDLCAGTGKGSLPLLKRGIPVTAIDVSAKMLDAYARKATGLPLTTIHADCTNPPLAPDSCPAILMIGGLHHIPDRATAVANACRALTPGGLLIVHEPLISGQSHWLSRVLTNVDALLDVPRVLRALRRRLGLHVPTTVTDDRPHFTPFEQPFRSAYELTALLPPTMQLIDLRSRIVLSDHAVCPALRPFSRAIVAIDNWLSRTGRAGWTGNAIWCVAKRLT